MISPIDYSLDVQSPVQTALQGFQTGLGLRQITEQQQQAEQQRLAQQQMSADLMAASKDVRLLPQVMVRYPQLADKLKVGWEAMSSEQQRNSLDNATQVLSALQSGRPDVAKKVLLDRAEALRNSGDERGAKTHEDMATWAETHPESLKIATGAKIAALPGGDKVIEGIAKLGGEFRAQEQAPADLATKQAGAREAAAKATTAEVTAKFAESQALADLEVKGWNVKQLAADIDYKKQSLKIQAMQASLAKSDNDLRRQELELKIAEAKNKVETAAREKVAEFDSQVSSFTDARTLISEIKSLRDEALVNPTGLTAGAALMPGSNARTQAGKIEQLQNSLAAANLDKLKGAMSDKDIAFLKNIASNLDKWQSDSRFASELDKIDGALVRADAAARKKYGAPPAPTVSNPAPAAAKAPEAKAGVTVSNW